MADITKCSNEKCMFKKQCFRYTVPPNDNQSYQEFKDTMEGELNTCTFFILNDNSGEDYSNH